LIILTSNNPLLRGFVISALSYKNKNFMDFLS